VKPYANLLILVAVSVMLWWRPIVATWAIAWSIDAYTSILLILPLALALVYVQRREGVAVFEPEVWIGLVVLAASLLLRGTAAWNIWHLSSSNQLAFNMFALVIWWIGSVVLCFGIQTFRLQIFPLCFLFLIVPLPERVLDWITYFLQHQSATATTVLFRIARIPVKQEGVFITIPGLYIEVARQCSSIRSSVMLVITTLILAQLFLSSWWRKVLLVTAAIPLSIAKNAVRIFTITALGTRVDPDFLEGRLHRQGGVVFLGLAIAGVAGLLGLLRKSESVTVPARLRER
jgi:exosortase